MRQGNVTASDVRFADVEGDVDVFFVGAGLAWRHAVLARVEAVVCGVDDVGVSKNVGVLLEPLEHAVNHFVDGLEGLDAATVVEISALNGSLVQLL